MTRVDRPLRARADPSGLACTAVELSTAFRYVRITEHFDPGRMRLEDLIAKMEQIAQQAELTMAEYPHGHPVERQRLIAAIARQVRAHLNDQLRLASREAPAPSEGRRLRVVRP